MKKKKLFFILIIITVILIISLLIRYSFTYFNNKLIIENNETQTESIIEDNNTNEIDIYTEHQYTDTNPVKIGIYIQNGNTKKLITEKYKCSFAPENIMGLFFVVPTNEETLPNTSFDTLWKNYINNYPNSQNYRIGYNISFTLNNGELFDKTILNPDNAYYMFPKVMVFLYDDVNLVPGKKYYHITNDEMYENTICSSIKLVGDVESKNIISDITLTAFCFDSEDDFDENNKYRGNSSYTITISRE